MEALEIVGLSNLADRPAPNLSGGQQQRVALARAIATNSKLLLMDEPMSNLDSRLRTEVRTQFRAVAKQLGTTVLYVTHDQEEAMALGDQMALMRDGEILQRGTPKELYDRAISREVAEFFGPMNVVEGEAVGPREVLTAFGRIRLQNPGAPAKHMLIGIRPERVQLAALPNGNDNSFEVTVESRLYLGGVNVYQLRSGETIFRASSIVEFDDGAKVCMHWPVDDLRVFAVPSQVGGGGVDTGGVDTEAKLAVS
jgi:ABC-type Fe3+/spermidine/putrescine transport system ATPase subunit